MDIMLLALMEIVFSFLPLATAAMTASTARVPTAATGLLPSIRTTRTSPGTCSSVPAMSSGTSATAPATTGNLSDPSQNNGLLGLCPASRQPAYASSIKALDY